MTEPFRARLATAQGEPEIGSERIVVYRDGQAVEELRLHDYARLYALPGLYEQIVQGDLGCRSPAKAAELLGVVLDELHRDRALVRVIDLAAGNGVSGEELLAAGLHPVLGLDLVPEARAAALRDRPDVYDEYLTLDLLALTDGDRDHIRSLTADVLACVTPVSDRPGALPPGALLAAAALLTGDALVLTLHDPRHGDPDPLTETRFGDELGVAATRVRHERYLHRFTVAGNPYELDASVWRLRR